MPDCYLLLNDPETLLGNYQAEPYIYNAAVESNTVSNLFKNWNYFTNDVLEANCLHLGENDECQLPFLSWSVTKYNMFSLIWHYPTTFTCFDNNEAGILDEDGDNWPMFQRDPCVAYHDPDKRRNCAICKGNLLRIFAKLTATDSVVFCGSVRGSTREASTGAYTYMDPGTATQDDYAAHTY